MPAAAVIPAPIAYTKVVAVKKLVVRPVSRAAGPSFAVLTGVSWDVWPVVLRLHFVGCGCVLVPCIRFSRTVCVCSFAVCSQFFTGVLVKVQFNPAAVLFTECSRWAGTVTLNKTECLK